jgi:hypothetical protein
VWLQASRTAAADAVSPFARDELTIPTQNGVWRYDSRDLRRQAATVTVSQFGEPSALAILETQALPSVTSFQNSILFGVEGRIPFSETRLARDADLKGVFQAGREIEMVVLDVDATARRIHLQRHSGSEAARGRRSAEDSERTEGRREQIGSLADKLRDALKSRPR